MQRQATPNARHHAPELRAAMTDAERRLWAGLRAELLGVKFSRQHPLGAYVLDFACLDPKIAIEIDGSQHLEQIEYDAERDRWLAAQGYVVLRFWANETLSNTSGVLSQIQEAVAQCLAPPCRARAGLQAGTAQRARRMRLETPASPPALPQRGRESTPRSPS
ncbi:MAG: DUF559 domain-containing protein [Burkholderiaceae bacterium]|nr:DUF559 domain-containing protein [Burkholderiaceae bacterium]